MTLFEIKIQLPARERTQGTENAHEKEEQWGHFFALRRLDPTFEVSEYPKAATPIPTTSNTRLASIPTISRGKEYSATALNGDETAPKSSPPSAGTAVIAWSALWTLAMTMVAYVVRAPAKPLPATSMTFLRTASSRK
jgi:hypothetical protein